MRRLTRRRFLREAGATAAGGAAALGGAGAAAGTLASSALLVGCGSRGPAPAATGDTRLTRWIDPVGDGQLRVGRGEPLVDRLELGARRAPTQTLATLAHLTDAHVLDAASPARVPFLDRLGSPFESTFRPQETLTSQVLAGAVAATNALRPQLVIQGGDLIDNDQRNELARALAVLAGAPVAPGSGPGGAYYGVQIASDPDPFYYRPDVDAPIHRGLLTRAVRPFRAPGLRARWAPVLGDHDALVAGELVPTALTESLAIGDRALWDLPRGLTLPPGTRLTEGGSPDGPPLPGVVDQLLQKALAGPTVSVPADPARAELSFSDVIQRLEAASGRSGDGDRLDYVVDLGAAVRVIVLDLVRRNGGSGGLVAAGQPAWLEHQLHTAGDRWVLVVSHQPLASSANGDTLLSVLDASPRVIAAIAGHTHRNRITPRSTAAGGYWLITTASLIDFPQQARALTVHATAGGGVMIETFGLDHVGPTGGLGEISRQLAFIDAQGGRPQDFAGTRLDRNVRLYRSG